MALWRMLRLYTLDSGLPQWSWQFLMQCLWNQSALACYPVWQMHCFWNTPFRLMFWPQSVVRMECIPDPDEGQMVAKPFIKKGFRKNNISVMLGNDLARTKFHKFALANVTLISNQPGWHRMTHVGFPLSLITNAVFQIHLAILHQAIWKRPC